MDAGPTVAVKLFIDKEKQKVLFAESDKDFVDVLFSFLTLPLGTIVRVLGKQSELGCLDEIYKSVESLSIDRFQTNECKTMLLKPYNAAAAQCDRLIVKLDHSYDPKQIYLCGCPCRERTFSSIPNTICKNCKGTRNRSRKLSGNSYTAVSGGVFVKSFPKMIVTDDLQVAPASTGLMFSILEKFELNENANIDEKVLHLNSNKIINFLKRALICKQPLCGLCFDAAITPDSVDLDELPANLFPKQENDNVNEFNAIKIKLIQAADDSSVVYAEVGHDFVDLVFGLLAVPLGSIIKAYGQWPLNGCADNLYRSLDGSARGCIKEDCRSLLLSPKLAPFFGCSINVLQVEEADPNDVASIKCFYCFKWGRSLDRCGCLPSGSYETVFELNPKSPCGENGTTTAYIKAGIGNFIVTNDLRILEFSLANTLQLFRTAKIPKEKLVEKELALDRKQIMKILRAALITREALSSALLPPKKKRYPYHH